MKISYVPLKGFQINFEQFDFWVKIVTAIVSFVIYISSGGTNRIISPFSIRKSNIATMHLISIFVFTSIFHQPDICHKYRR